MDSKPINYNKAPRTAIEALVSGRPQEVYEILAHDCIPFAIPSEEAMANFIDRWRKNDDKDDKV